MAQCTARSKRTKERCRDHAMQGTTVCYHHGGKTPRGYALPQTKTGRHSKVLTIRLAQTYAEAKENQRLLSLRDDLAVCESRLMDLFRRVDTGESGALWADLQATLAAFRQAQDHHDMVGMDGHFAALRRLVEQGSTDYQAWSEIYKVWETRCKLTREETRTLMAMQAMLSVEQVTVMMSVMTEAIQRAVLAYADEPVGRQILGAISADFAWIADREAAA
jgi:hypothetical protein